MKTIMYLGLLMHTSLPSTDGQANISKLNATQIKFCSDGQPDTFNLTLMDEKQRSATWVYTQATDINIWWPFFYYSYQLAQGECNASSPMITSDTSEILDQEIEVKAEAGQELVSWQDVNPKNNCTIAAIISNPNFTNLNCMIAVGNKAYAVAQSNVESSASRNQPILLLMPFALVLPKGLSLVTDILSAGKKIFNAGQSLLGGAAKYLGIYTSAESEVKGIAPSPPTLEIEPSPSPTQR